MKHSLEEVKKELLKISTGDEWNEFSGKYPDIKMSEMDHEMKQHINKIVRNCATAEQRENPQIHYDFKKKKITTGQ